MTGAVKFVRLQVNTTGAWRDVIAFDAADDIESDQVLAAAEALGKVSKGDFRVVIKDPDSPRSPTVLMFWTPDTGWKDRR